MTVGTLERTDNRLAFLDQASFLALRATGLEQVAQWVWVYDRAIDLDALNRFHRNLSDGLLGRRIERSPLPFGRHRWIASPGGSDLAISNHPRPRTELGDWADERAQLPIDPEWGPGWHLGVQPMTEGSTAISLVASHCLVDGLGGCHAIAHAVEGISSDVPYPLPQSRARLRAVASDARETVQGAPQVVRALGAAAKLAHHQRRGLATARTARPTVTRRGGADAADDPIVLPAITIHLDLGEWNARAQALGGTTNSLFNGFASRLGERMGRRRAHDGAVTVRFAVSDRTEGDTRANAMSFATIDVDPGQVSTDLSGVRAAIKKALRTLQETPDASLQVLPLTTLTPKRVVRRLATVLFDDPSVGCSNLRAIDPMVGRPDGTDADLFSVRGVTQHLTRGVIEQIGGQVTLACGSIRDKFFITLVAYQLDGPNSKTWLRELVAHTLAEFDLTGAID